MIPEADVLYEAHGHRLAASAAHLVEMLIEDNQFVIFRASEIQLVLLGVAKAGDRGDSVATALLICCKVDLTDDL